MLGEDTITLDLPATGKHLNILGPVVNELLSAAPGVENRDGLAMRVQLAIHELCTNIADHAYAGRRDGRIRAMLTLEADPARLIVDLYDSGLAFDSGAVLDPRPEQLQSRGYGLFIIRQVMDEVDYDSRPGDNHWRLVKNLG